jgi:hypothetical protein
MDSTLDKARAAQNFLERIANAVPGFKGYREHELRRDADRIHREHLAAQLDACKKSLDAWASEATRAPGGLDSINDIETARKRLDRVANRIRYADRGYSGFFDVVKVDEALLARVYEFDLGLLGDVEGVRAAAQGPADGVKGLIGRLDALDAKLGEREAMLSGVR